MPLQSGGGKSVNIDKEPQSGGGKTQDKKTPSGGAKPQDKKTPSGDGKSNNIDEKLKKAIVRLCTEMNKPKKNDRDSIVRFVKKNIAKTVRWIEEDLNKDLDKKIKLSGVLMQLFIEKRMIEFYIKMEKKEEVEEPKKKKIKMPRDWYPDQETFHREVVNWCSEIDKKERPNTKNHHAVWNWVYANVKKAIDDIEEKLGVEMIGIGLSTELVQTLMVEYFLCDYVDVDMTIPEPCYFCGAPEIKMNEDGSNWKKQIWECESKIPILEEEKKDPEKAKKDPEKKTKPLFVRPCDTPACCFKCSGLPEDWDWRNDPFYCKNCNNPEIIAQTEEINKNQEIVDIDTPPVDLDTINGPAFKKVTRKVEGVRVAHAMGGGGKTITQKKAREMLGMAKGVPSQAELDRCANPTIDTCGNLEAPPLLKARKRPPAEVFVVFLEQYQEHDIAKKWHEKDVLVKDMKIEMLSLYKEAKVLMKEGQEALDHIEEKMKKEKEEYDAGMSKDEIAKDKMRNGYLKKRQKIVEKKVQEEHPEQYKSLTDIESKLTMIRELLRICKNKLTKINFEKIEMRCDKFWDKFECSDIEDDEDLSSGSEPPSDEEEECYVDNNG